MSSATLTLPVVLYENERFWIGRGFSKQGLVPGERGPYSTDDGSLSWNTLEQAQEAMLGGKGWKYTNEEFAVCKAGGYTDEDGWRYSIDFTPNAITLGASKRGMLHVVRRRRLLRTKCFHPEHWLPKDVYAKCSFCDSDATNALSFKMLEALAYATLLHQTKNMTEAIVLQLKNKLIDSLGIGARPVEGKDPLYRLATLHYELDRFAGNQQTALSKASHMFQSENEILQAMPDRVKEISDNHFVPKEREAIAGLMVRYLDPEYRLHCDKESCGKECEFSFVHCPNAGCKKILSRKHLPKHDESCEFKVIECPLGCGDTFPRNRQNVHLRDACSLRKAECPFRSIGCPAVVQAKDTPEHLTKNTDSHLLLVVDRMMEYESIIKTMNRRIELLSTENTALRTELAARTEHTASDKQVSNLSKQVGSLTKRLANLEGKCRTEFKKIDTHSHVK